MIPTCIDDFILCGSTFAVLENRLWRLHKTGAKPENYLSLTGQSYSLEESEELPKLEFECYCRNSSIIEKRITAEIKKSQKSSEEELKGLKNIFRKFQEDGTEKRVLYQAMHDYMNIYLKKKNGKSAKVKEIKVGHDVNIPKLEELKTTSSLLSRLYNGRGFLFSRNCVYDIDSGKTNGSYLKFKGKKLSFNLNCKSNEFQESYRKIIHEHVVSRFRDDNSKIVDGIRKINKQKEYLEDEIAVLKKSIEFNNIGDVGYRKKSQYYEVYADIPEFILKHENKYYLFDKIRISIDVKFNGDSAILVKKPYVPDDFMPYNHPFVYHDGDICLGNGNYINGRLEELNIYFNTSYNLNEHDVSRRIAVSLDQAKQVILDGYVGKIEKIKPVKRLEIESNFEDEFLKGGLLDSRALRIPKNRIFPGGNK